MLVPTREKQRQKEQRERVRVEQKLQRNLLFLKVKAKSLTKEAKIIRKEELRIKNMKYFDELTQVERNFTMWKLQGHRTWDVRNEARATHLARAFLRGKKYSDVEPGVTTEGRLNLRVYILKRIVAMVHKYGGTDITEFEIKKWLEIN